MKILLKTTGSFMLVDPQTGDEMQHNRPSLVGQSNFVQSRTAIGQLKVLSNEVPDTLTDADFLKFWNDSDKDEALAVQSFLASFAPKQAEEQAPKTTPKAGAK